MVNFTLYSCTQHNLLTSNGKLDVSTGRCELNLKIKYKNIETSTVQFLTYTITPV